MAQDSLPFSVSFDPAGNGMPEQSAYRAALDEAGKALDWLRASHADGSIEILTVPAREHDLQAARPVAEKLGQGATDILVFGIGGSSLGGQALAQLRAPETNAPRVTFIDNPDPWTFEHTLKRLALKTTRFVAISKSGGTAETLIQALAAADALEKAGEKDLARYFAIITEPGSRTLRSFAESIGAPALDHPAGVGGRYSVLTVVGMLPAMLMGLDPAAFRRGAAAALAPVLQSAFIESIPAAQGAALHFALSQAGRLADTVLWGYADKLALFNGWWRQLWAESLGKDGKGATPVNAVGPVDQHSQLQLYLGGPINKLFTLLSLGTEGEGAAAPDSRARTLGLDYLAGKTMGDLVAAEARATADTLVKRGRPVRRIHADTLDEYTMGALFMHFMLEVMIMGRLMGVNPFDQPAVEEGKVLARKYLSEG
jgi:glucose-6-phosphate isomerase